MMLSEDGSEKRHGPPGVNSKALSAVQSAADLEVLRDIEHVYFTCPTELDAGRYVLESAPYPSTCQNIEEMFTKLKRQQQVVSAKALHLISQQRDNCDREFNEIQTIREELTSTLDTCQNARRQLKTASNNLTVSAFVILANFRKRQIIKSVLKALELLQSLRNVEKDVAKLMEKNDYEVAVELILKSRKDAAEHNEYTCIGELAVRLQDTLALTEDKFDTVLSEICYNFDGNIFRRLRKAYSLLGKTQVAMEQLHMHYQSAINTTSLRAIQPFTSQSSVDVKFKDLCSEVPLHKAPTCLLNLCENLFMVMRSYKLLVDWHSKHDEEDLEQSLNATLEIENNLSREYIRQKLKSGPIRLWEDVNGKVSTFLESTGLEEYPFEKFIQMLGILRKLTQVAEIFCGDKADILQNFIKTQSLKYIKNYHCARMEELKLFLENEGWETCPVKSNFTLLHLQEFKLFKRHLIVNIRSDKSIANSVSQSDGTSSVNSHDDSVYIAKYFSSKSNRSPFEIFRNDNFSSDDIFGLEPDYEVSDESDDEPEELKLDYVDEEEPTKKEANDIQRKPKNTVIVTSTTLSVLRNCGQYLQICRYLPQISLEVIMLMNQFFDYYFYTVHSFFTSDLEVASTTLYSVKLNAALKRIANSLNSNVNGEGDGKGMTFPELPSHLNLNDNAQLFGLSERIVAVESVMFLAKQFDFLQTYLESIVAPHQRVILEHFKDNTLHICPDLRMPVYMASVSKSIDAISILIAMSQVKWDVKNVAVDHSPYVDVTIRQVQVLSLRLDNILTKVPFNCDVLTSIWTMVSKFIVHFLVEGFSNASKCSNGGRGLMQLDYRQLFVKLEKISGLKPIPYQDYVDRYVKAYYLPRSGLEDFVKEHLEYSDKHLLALVSCACENKRDRQELTAVVEARNNL